MTNTLSDFYPQLITHPEIQDLVKTNSKNEADQVLQGMKDSSLTRGHAEDLEELLTSFIIDHGEEVASFEGYGSNSCSSRDAMAYLQEHHPQAAKLLQTQARILERLLGKDGAAAALDQARVPFAIRVLQWGPVYLVLAEEFESAWFDKKATAIAFAQTNYGHFLEDTKYHRYLCTNSND